MFVLIKKSYHQFPQNVDMSIILSGTSGTSGTGKITNEKSIAYSDENVPDNLGVPDNYREQGKSNIIEDEGMPF